jgi:hypothetical protein
VEPAPERRPLPLFRRLLGDGEFAALPATGRALPAASLPGRFEGEVQVRPARGAVARALAGLLGFPRHAQAAALSVTIAQAGEGETWVRHFPPRPMRSRLWPDKGRLCERFGPVRLAFRLALEEGVLHWRPVALSVFGLPLPLRLAAGIEAREWEQDGRYRFLARGALPGIGCIVDYEGWLDTASTDSSTR